MNYETDSVSAGRLKAYADLDDALKDQLERLSFAVDWHRLFPDLKLAADATGDKAHWDWLESECQSLTWGSQPENLPPSLPFGACHPPGGHPPLLSSTPGVCGSSLSPPECSVRQAPDYARQNRGVVV